MGRRKSDKIWYLALGVLVIGTQIICITTTLINSYWTAKFISVIDAMEMALSAIPPMGY